LRTVFVDTGFWIAILNPRDELHSRARQVSASLGPARLITSEMVLTELLNEFARRGAPLRQAAVAFVRRLRGEVSVEITPQASPLFEKALDRYAARADKTWSLTDCASFHIMESLQTAEALSYDRHFEQAGFRALLREGYSG